MIKIIFIISIFFSTTISFSQSLLISNSVQSKTRSSGEDLIESLSLKEGLVNPYCKGIDDCLIYQKSNNISASTLPSDIMRDLKSMLKEKLRLKYKEISGQYKISYRDLDSIQRKQSIIYYRLNNMSIIIDTSVSIDSRKQMFDSLSALAGELNVLKNKLDYVQWEFLDINDRLIRYDTSSFIKSKIDSIPEGSANNAVIYNAVKNELDNTLESFSSDLKNNQVQKKELDSTQNSISITFNRLLKKYIVSKEIPKKGIEFGALPSINSVLGSKQLNPNISVHGFYQGTADDKPSKYAELKFFTGTLNTNEFSVIKTLFVPETSSWGISGKFTWGFSPAQDDSKKKIIGLNLETHYLSKKIKSDTLKESPTFSPGLVQIKTGLEIAVIPNTVSLYTNVNSINFLDNLDDFNKTFQEQKKSIGFVDFGVKMLLGANDESLKKIGLKLLIDFSGIVNGGDVNSFINSEDKIIPVIRIGGRVDL